MAKCERINDFGFDIVDEYSDAATDDNVFVDTFTEFLEGNLRQLGIANLIAGIIVLFLTVATGVLIWSIRYKDKTHVPKNQHYNDKLIEVNSL